MKHNIKRRAWSVTPMNHHLRLYIGGARPSEMIVITHGVLWRACAGFLDIRANFLPLDLWRNLIPFHCSIQTGPTCLTLQPRFPQKWTRSADVGTDYFILLGNKTSDIFPFIQVSALCLTLGRAYSHKYNQVHRCYTAEVFHGNFFFTVYRTIPWHIFLPYLK